MKISDMFKLPLELRNDLVHFSKTYTCYFKVESVKSRDEELQVTYCIHQAVNNHDNLVEALGDAISWLSIDPQFHGSPLQEKLTKALKEAQGVGI